ncbi:MAG: PKD domain-containing protein, partial [Candidatus Bipolaricaulis sp.]|nr:PKD domain-containing protein [Candidatus Bipolaricaulis sp.]
MKRILLVVAFVVGTFACSAWSADPLVVGIEPSTQDAWRALAAQFEASTGVSVKTQPITQNSIAQQVVLQAYQKSGKLHFVMLQTAWTSNLSRYLVDLTEIDSPLRAGGVNPVVVDGRTVGVPISFADGWFLAVTAWPADRGPVVPFLIAVAGGGSTTATVAPTGVAPAKTTGPSFIPPGKLAVAQHNPKVDGALESLVAAAQSALSAAATSVLSALPATARAAVDHVAKGLGVPFSADTATVTVVLESRPGRTSTSNVAALSALGLKGPSVKASSSLIKVSVPISQLATLASQLTGVSFIRPPYTPHALGTPSQGVAAIGATAFHTAGFRGTGVKVAVIDLGFAGLSAAQTRGDLPAGAMQNDLTGTGLQSGISHGTAVAEIVADIAPDAQLHLIKIADEVDLDLAVTYCIDNGIDIINHSLGWYNTNNYDGTGAICDIARRAINAGILWVNAAGNEAQSHWEGAFIDGNGDGWHDQDITLYVSSGSPIILYMTWNEWPQSSTDYDLYLYDPNGAVAASSTKHQTGTEEPTELVQTTAAQSGTYRIRFQGAGSRNLEIYSLYQGLSPYVSSSSLLAPADLTEAVSVGAINHATYTTGPQEPYSSQGPTNDGRTKPDLACPDNVATGTSPYTTFPGTSGAAPHAAGAAALLLSRQPTLSEPALRAQLLANTVSMGSANIYGQGRLSLQPPTAPNQAPTASFTFSPSSPTTGTTVSFNASASTDPDGSIVAYTWNFGDGVTGSGVTASHAYAVAGSYTVSLTVRDDDSATNSTTRTVTVAAVPNQAPTASFTFSPSSPTTGTTVSFNASASTDPDGSIVAYTWN